MTFINLLRKHMGILSRSKEDFYVKIHKFNYIWSDTYEITGIFYINPCVVLTTSAMQKVREYLFKEV